MNKMKDTKEETALAAIHIEERIMIIRGEQVLIDRDLAEVYQVEVKRLNEQVKRNIERFPERFRFQLTDKEKDKLVANCDRFERMKHSSVNPFVFTEQGVAMLSTVLRSETAVNTSIRIMDAFVNMRKILANYAGLFQRMDAVERKLLETDNRLEQVFKALETHEEKPKEGIFFDGQVFDAYVFALNIVRSAKKSIVLIDNYIDENVLVLFGNRAAGVKITLLTANLNRQLVLAVSKANAQYPVIELKQFTQSHDRFLIIDETDVYLLGASLKDLGKKWFGFSLIDKDSVTIINKLKNLI
jgi:hypothetical protein